MQASLRGCMVEEVAFAPNQGKLRPRMKMTFHYLGLMAICFGSMTTVSWVLPIIRFLDVLTSCGTFLTCVSSHRSFCDRHWVSLKLEEVTLMAVWFNSLMLEREIFWRHHFVGMPIFCLKPQVVPFVVVLFWLFWLISWLVLSCRWCWIWVSSVLFNAWEVVIFCCCYFELSSSSNNLGELGLGCWSASALWTVSSLLLKAQSRETLKSPPLSAARRQTFCHILIKMEPAEKGLHKLFIAPLEDISICTLIFVCLLHQRVGLS